MNHRNVVRAAALIGCMGALAFAAPAPAGLRPDKVHMAEAKAAGEYVSDGVIIGGDRAIDDVVIKGIRRAANNGFERIVIDLDAGQGASAPASIIERPPYYHVSVSPGEDRVIMTVWGHPKLAFDASKVLRQLDRSKNLGPFELLPRLDEASWTFSFGLKGLQGAKVFHLKNPLRIVVDVRTQKKK